MTIETLNNGVPLLEQRTKINANFADLDNRVSAAQQAADAANSDLVVETAGAAIGGHQPVAYNDAGHLVLANAATPQHALRYAGVTTAAVVVGATVPVQRAGVLEHSGWSWMGWQPVYLSTTGALTQTPPTSGFVMVLGIALTSTRVAIGALPAIFI
jgi:hypothetical protein